jgi:DALR anticodon binding domain
VNSNLADFDRQENIFLVRLLRSYSYDRSFSFQQLLQQQLLTATIKYLERATTPITQNSSSLLDKVTRLPLHLDRASTDCNAKGYFYRSAVCFSLASHTRMSPLTIARQLREIILDLGDDRSDIEDLETLTFTIEPNAVGWVDFFLDDRTLAIWLSCLLNVDFTPFRSISAITDNIFPIQYSHGRCRSLLLLAARQEIINLPDDYFSNLSETILFSSKITYLNRDDRLIFEEDLELDLIEALLKVTDFLAGEYSTKQLIKMAFFLSESFLKFYDSSPIFNPRDRDRRQLIYARLGLIVKVEFLFKQILIRLEIEPLLEL